MTEQTRTETAPPADEVEHYLATALTIAAEAAELLEAVYGKYSATRKSDGTLVTAADRAVDELILARLRARHPDHKVLSEEGDTCFAPEVPYTWVVDPLDGTTNFARGLPVWGVSLALLYHGAPIVGVLQFPLLRATYSAVYRGGAWLNGAPIRCATLETPDDEHFLMCCTRTPRRYQLRTPLKPRILGSAAYHIATVADGSAVAGIEATPKLWDLAAALLILREAGGIHRRLDDGGSVFPIAANPTDYANEAFPLLLAANQALLAALLPTIAPVASPPTNGLR